MPLKNEARDFQVEHRLLDKLLVELASYYTNDTKLRKRDCETQQQLECWWEKLDYKHASMCKANSTLLYKAQGADATVRECG